MTKEATEETPPVKSKTDLPLVNFIKYCLAYIKLTQDRGILAQEKYSAHLNGKYFSLIGLLNGDLDGNSGEVVNLETFYQYDPKEVPQELKEVYAAEKAIANCLEDIYNKYRNDQFTKQINFNFGYFDIELPKETEAIISEDEPLEENKVTEKAAPEIQSFPLFTTPVRMEKGNGKYWLYTVDPEIQVNVGVLETILGSDLYYQLVEKVGSWELDGQLTIPLKETRIFNEIWQTVKSNLKLKDVIFNEGSFSLEKCAVSLGMKSNYFLAEDLQKLAQLEAEKLNGTCLSSWVDDTNLSIQSEIPEESDLYFPFLYDKFQLRSLSLIKNKASIIQGPPGTGKSETISNLLAHLAATGSRVLFVSQKAQALKVVKDKLKGLGVKYLFGYVPNPRSPQLSDEDEWDGVAPQLAALDAFVEQMENDSHAARKSKTSGKPLAEIVGTKTDLRNTLNESIQSQRQLFTLKEEFKKLSEFDLRLADPALFDKNFSYDQWSKLVALKNDLERLTKLEKEFETHPDKERFFKLFSHLEWPKNQHSKCILEIKGNVAKTGYDRHSRLARTINNKLRQICLSNLRNKLPREIIDYIDQTLNQNISRRESEKALESLHLYCVSCEGVNEMRLIKVEIDTTFQSCAVSEEQFNLFCEKVGTSADQASFERIKNSVKKYYETAKAIAAINFPHGNHLSAKIKVIEDERKARIAQYIQNIVAANLVKRYSVDVKTRRVIKELSRAFGKSKKAFKTFDRLRSDHDKFKAILAIIPVWIMELDDASRIVPLEAGLFDYVILDEASQCNVAYTLPAMFRAKQAIFVGDSEQMRDGTIMFKSNKAFDELAHRYLIPEEMQIKSTGNAVQSVLDIASLKGFRSVPLRYHYRSPKELIDFSNRYFYKPKGKELIVLNSSYLTYEDTNRIMLVHHVQPDLSKEISDKVSVSEAEAILKLFKHLKLSPRYKDKSVGILTFFNAQATLIRETFEAAGFKEEDHNYKISIVEGIQGDEKDILLYSFVIRSKDQKSKYVPLTGEQGDIRGEVNKGRVNVAFSRAKTQVHCFVSMPISEIPDQIWIKKYLEYVEKYGEITHQSDQLNPFDSYFEEEFYHTIRTLFPAHYKIQNQIKSCGFKIDFVVSNTKNGKRLAVECDGPTHFKNELDEELGIYIESDEERQTVLEAARWNFYRLRYSDWIDEKFDRKKTAQEIIRLLG